jgi:RNA polymerase sigma-70 factor (ECF subfamily)
LRDALARIPLDDQIALELAYLEGMPGRDVARVLGIGENTVRSRLARAKERVRAALAELAATPDEAARAEARLA